MATHVIFHTGCGPGSEKKKDPPQTGRPLKRQTGGERVKMCEAFLGVSSVPAHLNQRLLQQVDLARSTARLHDRASTQEAMQSVADLLRELGSTAVAVQAGEDEERVHTAARIDAAIDLMDDVAACFSALLGRNSREALCKYSSTTLIETVLACDLLRSAATLQQSLERAIRLCVPPLLQPSLLSTLTEEQIVPSRRTVERSRFNLDCAFTLMMRKALWGWESGFDMDTSTPEVLGTSRKRVHCSVQSTAQ